MKRNHNSLTPLSAPTVDRQLVVVDLENLCGGSEAVEARHDDVRRELSATLNTETTSFTVVAYGRFVQDAIPELPFNWPKARILVGSGIDGADLRLLEVLDTEPVAERSMRIVLCSGDGIFAESVARLVASGHHVTVFARPGTISRRLALVANEVIEMLDGNTSGVLQRELAA